MGGKVRENLLRRMAERQGYGLRRSRRRDPLARDFGIYWIVDPAKGVVVASGSQYENGMDLDEVEQWLRRPGKARKPAS